MRQLNTKTLQILRAGIAAKQFKKKVLARELGISPSRLSMYLGGDLAIPDETRKRLFELLQIGREDTQTVLLSTGIGLPLEMQGSFKND